MRDNQRAWLGTCSMCELPKAGGVKILFMVKRYPAAAPEVVEAVEMKTAKMEDYQ